MNNQNKLYINIENNMQKYCKEKELTLSELEKMINVDEANLNNCKELSIKNLMMISKVLEVELIDLLKGEE